METLIWRLSEELPEEQRPFDQTPAREENGQATRQPRCSHFSIATALVVIPGLHREMQVPVYRCSLAEVMMTRLRSTPQGGRLADSLEAEPLEGIPRLLGGPDLEAITTTACIPDRCRQSCQQAFIQILSDLGIDSALPQDS